MSSVGYCKPDKLQTKAEPLGAYLEGEREETSLYELEVRRDAACKVLCAKVRRSDQWLEFFCVCS